MNWSRKRYLLQRDLIFGILCSLAFKVIYSGDIQNEFESFKSLQWQFFCAECLYRNINIFNTRVGF